MSNTPGLPPFERMVASLAPLGALNSSAELHGMLSGYLCGGGRYSREEWMGEACGLLDITAELESDVDQLLGDLYDITLQQLNDSDMVFQLLLPTDDADIGSRIVSLSQWCHGFLTGFGSSGFVEKSVSKGKENNPRPAAAKLPSDVADTLRDFAAFVQISADSEENTDSEADYMEIVEYVRVATLGLFMDLGELPESVDETEGGSILH